MIMIALGPWMISLRIHTTFLLALGIPPYGFMTIDYYPLIPWFGVILVGYGIGSITFSRLPHRKKFLVEAKSQKLEAISWPGRHSLLLYLIHQPILIGLLWLILGTPHW
jgi:uncharacterized membrane protein